MAKFDELADKLYQMFNSYEYDFKMYDKDGKGIANPFLARYFYIKEPNFMVIVDEDNNNVEMHKAPIDMELFKNIFKSIRNICQYHAVKLDIKNYNAKITPKDYAPKIEKEKYIKSKQESILETKYDVRTVNTISVYNEDKVVKLNYLNLVSKNPIDKSKISGTIRPITIQEGRIIKNVSYMTFDEACGELFENNQKTLEITLDNFKKRDTIY